MSTIHDASGDAPLFLPEGAFVVQFKTDRPTAPDSLAGRVEHVVSGQAAHFTSPAELLTFLSEILRSQANPEAARGRNRNQPAQRRL